jgi:hypothetical protein
VVTSSNAATSATANQLLVYDSSGNLLQTVSTGGKGGVSGNAGGIEALGGTVAVVNYGSQNVSIFDRDFDGFHMQQLVAAASSPVSVAFGNGHLYILGTTKVESHPMYGLFGSEVSSSADGTASLLFGDGSAAQVGVLPGQLIVTEKGGTKNNTYGTIETVGLTAGGAVTGVATAVQNIPANPNAPFGLVTRGDDAYVTIAHSNEIALVRDGKVLTVTGSGTQNAPCWLALEGPFLFSSNSPSMSVSRYAVYGQKIVQDAAVAAGLSGDPTDIATAGGLVAVIDGSGHLSIFTVDEDGNLTLVKAAAIGAASNGVSVVSGGGFLP